MATQYTAGITNGQVWSADIANSIGAAWETYTPTWTSNATNPVLGNGTLTGTYCRINKLVITSFKLLMGSTTTYGTGVYRISLPIAARDADQTFGTVIGYDASTGLFYSLLVSSTTSTQVYLSYGTAGGVFAATVPITWAASDQVKGTFIYEAA